MILLVAPFGYPVVHPYYFIMLQTSSSQSTFFCACLLTSWMLRLLPNSVFFNTMSMFLSVSSLYPFTKYFKLINCFYHSLLLHFFSTCPNHFNIPWYSFSLITYHCCTTNAYNCFQGLHYHPHLYLQRRDKSDIYT